MHCYDYSLSLSLSLLLFVYNAPTRRTSPNVCIVTPNSYYGLLRLSGTSPTSSTKSTTGTTKSSAPTTKGSTPTANPNCPTTRGGLLCKNRVSTSPPLSYSFRFSRHPIPELQHEHHVHIQASQYQQADNEQHFQLHQGDQWKYCKTSHWFATEHSKAHNRQYT